jgi:hypothetical protein
MNGEINQTEWRPFVARLVNNYLSDTSDSQKFVGGGVIATKREKIVRVLKRQGSTGSGVEPKINIFLCLCCFNKISCIAFL